MTMERVTTMNTVTMNTEMMKKVTMTEQVTGKRSMQVLVCY